MKIKHYATEWSSSLKIPLTKKEKGLFRFLELSKDFEKAIVNIRKKYQIPPKGFSYLKENEIGLGIPKHLDFDKWDQYLEDESKIADTYGLVSTWGRSLSYFIKYNYMPKMAKEVVPRAAIFDGETTLRMLKESPPALLKRKVLIFLSQKLSKNQLKKLIDLQWDQIEKEIGKLPTWDTKKHTKIKLFKDIAHLKENKNKSWDEIMTYLEEKYPGYDRASDESYLRMLYSRYKKRLQQLPEKNRIT